MKKLHSSEVEAGHCLICRYPALFSSGEWFCKEHDAPEEVSNNVVIKKVTTSTGTCYLLNEEKKQIMRVHSGSNRFLYDSNWVNYMSATNLNGEPYKVGDNLYVVYGATKDMPWSCSTEIVSIEELEENREN